MCTAFVTKSQHVKVMDKIAVPNAYLKDVHWLPAMVITTVTKSQYVKVMDKIPVPNAYLKDVHWLPAMVITTCD